MLVLSRLEGESVKIGGVVRVIVKKINGRRVKLAIEAPPNVKIIREEIEGDEPSGDDDRRAA